MSQFYVSIIFLGIVLVVAALIMIAYDKKNSLDYVNKLNTKKEELSEIISDADQMIEEMNKFSDYVVNQMDLKNEQMCASLRLIEERIKSINIKSTESIKSHIYIEEKSANEEYLKSYSLTKNQQQADNNTDLNNEVISYDIPSISNPRLSKNANKPKTLEPVLEKVIPLNSKYRKVIQLAQEGLDDTDIARNLNLGKGEVNLIIETCRQVN